MVAEIGMPVIFIKSMRYKHDFFRKTDNSFPIILDAGSDQFYQISSANQKNACSFV